MVGGNQEVRSGFYPIGLNTVASILMPQRYSKSYLLLDRSATEAIPLGDNNMTVFKGSGIYHVGALNTNRQVLFSVVAAGAGATNGFLFLKGNNAFHPWIGQTTAPTTNQLIAQYRADYVVRYLSQYSIPIFTAISQTSVAADTITIGYETYVSNVLPAVTDIVDLYGKADRAAKTKPGLQTLATGLLSTASLDGGATLLFAANPNLADGTVSTAGVMSGLTVTLLTPSMY
jgi:hypothetical protein